ncbi:carbohydrate porin [Fulvimonas sp. R45]|uniref:carbohydrate porin n=1 Tax=Fulvimonas sp. R45 TaxID=3045937 RepID=UPI00265E6C81|nr:carbohydrate porin [Fulvimonas sp. R45]MDO1530486.1 carbohydrate porin [Fulvimonas sp. R45]
MRSKMLAVAIAASLGASSFAAAAAPAQTDNHTSTRVSASELAQLKAEIAALQQKVDDLQAQSASQAQAQQQTAQAVQQVQAQQQAVVAAPAPDAALSARLDKLDKLVSNTSLSGKMYFDFSHIDQKNSDTGKTAATGTGLDVKRFYLGVTHKFNDIWSANLTTDFNYVSNDGETNLFVKKAYVQGNFDKAAVLRIGSADMPWIPFVEDWYGFRYVENTLTDRLHYANSADWGLHMLGSVGDGGMFNYAVSAVNGGGYKNPSRSKNVDFEGRVGFQPVEGLMVALGGYSGDLGKETQTTSANHTAQRGDLMVAYKSSAFRLGAEYFTAKNWNNVTTPATDKADGYSVWGSVGLNDDLTLFARYDNAKLSKTLDPRKKDVYYNLGLQFAVTKGFDLAAVWKHESADARVATPAPVHVQNVKTNEIGVFGQVAF